MNIMSTAPTSTIQGTSNGFQVYQLFLALKNHFKNEGYDFFRYNGKITASFDSYLKRKDRFFFEKISKTVSKSDFHDLIVANLVYGETGLDINPDGLWIGVLASAEGKERLVQYRAKMESLEYNFKKDLTYLTKAANIQNENSNPSQFPTILSLYFDGTISSETTIILDDVLSIFKEWNKTLGSDPLWNKSGKFLRKYKSLISSNISDTNRYRKLMVQHAKSETI